MIYCSQCGTKNPNGSKFCANCGARVAKPEGLICPMCSTPNPVETVFCSNCGARLMPLIAESERAAPAPPIRGLSLPAKPAAPAQEPAPETPERAHDWLADLRAAAPAQAETATQADEDLPEWLRSARVEEAAAQPESAGQPQDSSWLRDLRGAAEAVPAAPVESAEEAAPSWLRGDVSAPEPAPATREEKDEEPSWVERLRAEAAQPADSGAPEEQTPSWVGRLRETARTDASSVKPSEREGLPDWLQAAEVEESRQAASVAEFSAEPLVPPAEGYEFATPRVEAESKTPDWFRMAMPAEEKLVEQPQLEPAARTEMPAWVAELTPTEFGAPAPSTEPVETSGPLAGLRGILPLANAIALPHVVSRLPTPANGQSGAQLFESILAAPALTESAPPVAKRRALTLRPLLYLLLLLSVVVPFFVPANFAASGLRIPGTGAAEFFDTVQTLPANATVLMAFDYDASNAGEMNLFAAALAQQMMKKRVKIVAVSTFDVGPQIAQKILDEVARANNYRYGVDYVNAGYIAGQEAGLAQFAVNAIPAQARDYARQEPLAQMALTQNLRTAADFALVVELAGTDDALKMWMEQVQTRVNARIAAATSAAVEPKARAYKDARQLTALMSGLVGAAQYEVLSGQIGQAVVRVNAQSAAQVVLVLAVILGNVAGLIAWASKRRSG